MTGLSETSDDYTDTNAHPDDHPHDHPHDHPGDAEGAEGAATPEPHARLRWALGSLFAVLALGAAVALVLMLTVVRPQAEAAERDQGNRAAAVRAAERFTVQVNNYDVASIDGYQESITPMLSPKFQGEFEKAMTDIVASVKQAEMTSKGQVLTSGVASLDDDSAQVLVVSDANVKTVFDARARHFRWEVDLVKIDGRWRIDNFTPVA